MQSQADLAEGKIPRLMFKLALPAILAQVINMLYNIVDRMYIGHIADVGTLALTGVGVTFPVIMLISAFASLVGMGGAPRAAISMGEGNNAKAQKILNNCLFMLLLVAAALTVVFTVFEKPILLAFGASDNTISYALSYMRIYVMGTVFVQLALGMNSFISTQGFAKTSMFTVVIGAAINIALDPVFIFGFNMGVQGAALATIISQAISAAWVIFFLSGHRTVLKICLRDMVLEPRIVGSVLALGVSPFIMQSTECVLAVVFNRSLLLYGGDIAVGAYTIISSINQLTFLPMQGLAQGAQPITSFNFGAKNMARVKESVKLLIKVCLIFSTALWLMLMIFPQLFIGIFTSDASLMESTIWSTRVFFATLFMIGFLISCQQSFLALGQAKTSLIIACLRKVVILIPLILLLPLIMFDKLFAVFLAEPIADFIASAVAALAFLHFARRELR